MDHGHHTTSSPSGEHNHNEHMGMSMAFHFGYKETILLDVWKTDTVGTFIVAVIGVFLVSVLYEFIKCYRDYMQFSCKNACNSREILTMQKPFNIKQEYRKRLLSRQHFYQTCFHALQLFLSYMLMLIFMTFNVWLCLVIIIGATCGYFLFGWIRISTLDHDHC